MDASKSGTKSGCFSEISRFLFEARKEATEVCSVYYIMKLVCSVYYMGGGEQR